MSNAAEAHHIWRSLAELGELDANFEESLHREFPPLASEWPDAIDRRRFLQLMGASLALAGASGCTQPPTEKIVPYVRTPESLVPGTPLYFATAMTLGGFATGLLVKSHMGRPIKVEGNPDHPASVGATDVFAQASLLTLYDPDRSRTVTHLGQISSWSAFQSEFRAAIDSQRARRGAGLRILTETVTSPTLHWQLRRILDEFPLARWHQYEPVNRDMVLEGARLAFGEYVNTVYRFDRADVILSLDADFLTTGPGGVRYARDFAARRRLQSNQDLSSVEPLNRLYVVECTPTCTGAKADHRWPLRAAEVEAFARAIASELGIATGEPSAQATTVPHASIAALVRDLEPHRGRSIVIAGDHQSPVVHALAHAITSPPVSVSRSAVRGLTSATLSQVSFASGLGSSWSQPLFANRPSKMAGSGRKLISSEGS